MPKRNINTETRLTRGSFFAERIIDAVRVGDLSAPVNLLLVGIGAHRYFRCGYEAYNTFAGLDNADVDYHATIVDLLPELCADFLERRELYVSFRTLNDLERDSKNAWQRYLQWTDQEEKIVNVSQAVGPSQRRAFCRDFPGAVIRSAAIPSSLARRLEDRTVVAVQGNIESIDLQQYGPFTAVSCVNVLYQIGREPREVMKALLNITSRVEQNGLVFLDLPWLPYFEFDPSFSEETEKSLLNLIGLQPVYVQGENSILYQKTLPYGLPSRQVPQGLPTLR